MIAWSRFHRRASAPLVMAVLSVAVIHGQSRAPSAGERVQAHVEFLADDLLEGRDAGTRGYDLAARYVAAALRTHGFEPAGDAGTFFQNVPLRTTGRTAGSLTLIPRTGRPVALRVPADALVFANHAHSSLEVTAPVVYAGYGVTAPDQRYDDYAGLDVRGKIVLTMTNAPPRFPGEIRAFYASADEKRRNAARHGAVGFLAFSPPEELRRYPWDQIVSASNRPVMTWLDARGRPADHIDELKGGAALGPDGIEKLFAHSPIPLAEVYEAARKGAPKPFEFSASARLKTGSRHTAARSANVIGLLRGTDPELAGTYVALTAHLDHVGVGEPMNGDAIYNGAYDNAVGCAVLLEVARAFAESAQRPLRSVLILFVTAEEHGLIGSDYFAAHPTVPPGSIVASVNLDMPFLELPVADVVAFGAEHSSLRSVVADAAAAAGVTLVPDPMPEENLFVRSDQYSLVKRGIPSVFLVPGLGTEQGRARAMSFLQAHYHRPSDDLSRPIDAGAAATFTRLNYLIAAALANQWAPPAWNPESFFGQRFARRAP